MENTEEASTEGRVTRSLRKRLVSVDSDASSSRPGTPVVSAVSKLTAITESSDDVSQPSARLTRRNSTTSSISTPTKNTRSAILRAETPDPIGGSPARRSTRKRSVTVTEQEHNYAAAAAATAALKLSAVKVKQQQFDALLEEDSNCLKVERVTRSQSKSPLSTEKTSPKLSATRKHKPGPKSKTKDFKDENFDSDIEIINLDDIKVEFKTNRNVADDKMEVIEIIDDSVLEDGKVSVTVPGTPKLPELPAENEDRNTQTHSAKKMNIKNVEKLEQSFKTSELENSDTRDPLETAIAPQTDPSKKAPSVATITRVQVLENLTPTIMERLHISANDNNHDSQIENNHVSPIRKSVAFNNSDTEDVAKSTYPKTPGLTKSKSYIDMDSSKETVMTDQSFQSDKGSVASFKDAQAHLADENIEIPETQEVEQQNHSHGSTTDFHDATNNQSAAIVDNMFDINPLLQRLPKDDVGNSLEAENTPHKVPKLLKSLQSSTPLLDATTKELKKTTTTVFELDQEIIQAAALDSLDEKSLRSGKKYSTSPNGSLKKSLSPKPALNKSDQNGEEAQSVKEKSLKEQNPDVKAEISKATSEPDVISNESDDVQNNTSHTAGNVSSTVVEQALEVAEVVVQKPPEDSSARFAKSWAQGVSGKNTSAKIDTIELKVDASPTKNMIQNIIEEKGRSDFAVQPFTGVSRRYHEESDSSLVESEVETDKEKMFFIDEAVEVDDEYNTGDSMDEDERCAMEEYEIIEHGESIGSVDTDEEGYHDDEEVDEKLDDFIVSDTEEDGLLLAYSDEEDLNEQEKNDDRKKVYKRIQTISSDSSDNEDGDQPISLDVTETVPDQEELLETEVPKSAKKIAKADITESIELEMEKENSNELNSAKKQKKKRKSSLHSEKNDDQLNDSRNRDGIEDGSQPLTLDVTGMIQEHSDQKELLMEGENSKEFNSAKKNKNKRKSSLHSKTNDDEQLNDSRRKSLDKSNISEFNSGKENKNKRKSSLHSKTNDDEQLNNSRRESLDKSNISARTAAADGSDNEVRPTTSSAVVKRQSLRRSDASIVDSKDDDDVQNKSLKSNRNRSKLGETTFAQDEENENNNLLEKQQRKSFANENSEEELETTQAEINRSKRVSFNQSQLNESHLSLNHSRRLLKEELQKSPADVSEGETNKSLKSSHQKTTRLETNAENGVKDTETSRRASLQRSVALFKERSASFCSEEDNSDSKRAQKHAATNRRLSVAAENYRNDVSDDDDVDEPGPKRVPKNASGLSVSFGQIKSSRLQKGKNLHSSFTIGVSVTKTPTTEPTADSDATPQNSSSSSESAEDDDEPQAKFSSEEEEMKEFIKIEKLASHFDDRKSRRQSLIFPVANAPMITPVVKLKRHSLCALTFSGGRDSDNNDDAVVFNPSQSFVASIDERKRELQSEKLKRKRMSKSFCGSTTLDNTIQDDVRHLHKKSKMVTNLDQPEREEMEQKKVATVPPRVKASTSTTALASVSRNNDVNSIQRILGRCEEILEAANLAKLEAKIDYKKRLVKLPKKSRKESKKTTKEKIEEEEESIVPLDSPTDAAQQNEKTKLALTKALKTSVAILTAPPLGKKRNRHKALLKIDDEKRHNKCLPKQVLDALSDTEPPMPKKKKKQEFLYHNEQENLCHTQHHQQQQHQFKSNAGNVIEEPLPLAEKKKPRVTKFVLPTGQVSVEPATPKKKATSNGFRESLLTPLPVGFKVRQILTAGQEQRKRKRHIEEQLPMKSLAKPQWTQSGLFMEEELPSSSSFASAHDARKTKKGGQAAATNANALNFKQKAMFRDNIPRERKHRVYSHNQF